MRDGLDEEFEEKVEVNEGVTVSEFLSDQGIQEEEVLAARNGTIISSSHELEDGDRLEVFDVIAGG